MQIKTDLREKSDGWALLILFVMGLSVRLIRLFDLDVWFDEVVILIQLQHSFAAIWDYCKMDNFPPLYSWVMKLASFASADPRFLRFFSAGLGALTPPAAFLLGRKMLDRRLGWILGLACVFSASLLYHHQIIRMYALFSFFACISALSFLRAIESNSWKDWLLTAAANLLGFYTFLFMGFLIAAQGLIMLVRYRFRWSKYRRAFMAQLPAVLLMLVWFIFALQRAREVREDFFYSPVTQADLVKLWVFFGTGFDFRNHYALTFLLNMPLMLGLLLSLRGLRRHLSLRLALAQFLLPILIVLAISLAGQSIFFKRYFIFLLPLYLALAFYGWLTLSQPLWRKIGVSLSMLVILLGSAYYFADYDEIHSEYCFITSNDRTHVSNGHAPSQMVANLADRLAPGEVVVHFSNYALRSFSFFPMDYYGGPSWPQYIYSKEAIKYYFGQRYLSRGDQIHSLADLQPPPPGLWLVTLEPSEFLFDDSTRMGRMIHDKWLKAENFPAELRNASYFPQETISLGRLTAIHFRRIRICEPRP